MTATSQRVASLTHALNDSDRILRDALNTHLDGKHLTAKALLFSGGNDSTTLGHWAVRQGIPSHAIHINTGIGIEATRQHVRDCCTTWGLPLIEEHPPPGSTYRELVLAHGFPGPGHHYKMYQRLKERGLRKARNQLISNPRRERVLFIAGRRRDESRRRTTIEEHSREGSVIWVAPFANWTTLDLNTYRELHDVPRNEVSDLIHMSGECLCGAFAKKNELDEISMWFPDVADHIRALEQEVEAAGQPRCRWGWGHADDITPDTASGPLCSSCDTARREAAGIIQHDLFCGEEPA